MDCQTYRAQLTELAGGELDEALRAPLASHLERCRDCAAELHELRQALAAFRAAGADEAPEGLAAQICARLGAAPAAIESRARPLPWSRLAALFALLALTALVAGVLGLWRAKGAARTAAVTIEEERAARRQAEEDLGRARGEVETARGELRAALERSRRDLDAASEGFETRFEDERRSRETVEAALAAMAAEDEAKGKRIRALEKGLADANGEARELREAWSRTEAELALLKQPRRAAAPDEDKPAAEPEGPAIPAAVAVVDRGGGLLLELRGPRERVVPELLALAADGSEPERARLALSTLENLLGDIPEIEEPRPEGGLLSDLNRGFGRWTQELGLFSRPDAEAAAADAGADSHRTRLDRIERLWKEERRHANP